MTLNFNTMFPSMGRNEQASCSGSQQANPQQQQTANFNLGSLLGLGNSQQSSLQSLIVGLLQSLLGGLNSGGDTAGSTGSTGSDSGSTYNPYTYSDDGTVARGAFGLEVGREGLTDDSVVNFGSNNQQYTIGFLQDELKAFTESEPQFAVQTADLSPREWGGNTSSTIVNAFEAFVAERHPNGEPGLK